MRIYYKEQYDKLFLSRINAVTYGTNGVEFHPISKAFSDAKKAGEEEVKNYIPYTWN